MCGNPKVALRYGNPQGVALRGVWCAATHKGVPYGRVIFGLALNNKQFDIITKKMGFPIVSSFLRRSVQNDE